MLSFTRQTITKPIGCCCTAVFAIVLCVLPGCANHSYTANTAVPKASYPVTIERAKKDKLYMILHSGINIYSMTSAEIDKTKQQLTVQLDKVDSLYLIVNGRQHVPKKAEPHKMHMYMSDSTSYTLDEPHTIFLNKVARIELVE